MFIDPKRIITGVISSYDGLRIGSAVTTEVVAGEQVVVALHMYQRRFVMGSVDNPMFLPGHMGNFVGIGCLGQKIVMTIDNTQGRLRATRWGLSPDTMSPETSATESLFDRIVNEVNKKRRVRFYDLNGSQVCKGTINTFAFVSRRLDLGIRPDGQPSGLDHWGLHSHHIDLSRARLELTKKGSVAIQVGSGEVFVLS